MPKENNGAMFVNDRKEKDTHPDFKGMLNVDGKEYWLSGWNKNNDRGPFVSLSVQPKGEKSTDSIVPTKAKEAPKGEGKPFDDEIPF